MLASSRIALRPTVTKQEALRRLTDIEAAVRELSVMLQESDLAEENAPLRVVDVHCGPGSQD